jgi:quinol monooxygenase YgiN
MNKFGIYGKLVAVEGQRDALAEILLEAADVLQSFEGCIMYVVNISENEPDTIWVTEIWEDSEAHGASIRIEEIQALMKRGRPLIAAAESTRLQTLGGKGL